MAPTKTGAKAGEDNSPRIGAVKNLSQRGRGPPADSGGLIGAKNHGSGDDGRSADSIRSGEERAPMKTGDKDG